MTKNKIHETNQLLKTAFETSYIHLKRANYSYSQIRQWTIDSSIFSDKEKMITLDAFVFRFIKLSYYMGDTLFKRILESIGEYRDNMSFVDVLDRLEKLELIESADKWMEFRKIRNILTHEYPDNKQETIKGLKLAFESFLIMEKTLKNLKSFSEK